MFCCCLCSAVLFSLSLYALLLSWHFPFALFCALLWCLFLVLLSVLELVVGMLRGFCFGVLVFFGAFACVYGCFRFIMCARACVSLRVCCLCCLCCLAIW